jgi:hypothetical protein
MIRRLGIPVLVALLALLGGAVSRAEQIQEDGLRVSFDAAFAPQALPRLQPAPIEVQVHGAIGTLDGSHPPPLTRLEIAVNRNGRISTGGLPVCSAAALQSTSSSDALSRCRPALVGHGHFRAEVALGAKEDIATYGKILAFNSRHDGRPALLLHLFAGVPVRFTLVVPLVIGHRSQGEFGTVLRARIPKIGGGLGSVTEVDLSLGRRYSFEGKRRSYLSAACGAPNGFDLALFEFVRGTFTFQGHKPLDATLIKTCHVR